jgi:uncharacterized membrane-anchored protein
VPDTPRRVPDGRADRGDHGPVKREQAVASGEIAGKARVGRDAAAVAGRLKPGEIAVIDSVDLDRAAAAALTARRPAAVVNGRPTISGRFPSYGAGLLIDAGIPLLDDVGSDLLAGVADGDRLRIDGVRVLSGERELARGRRQDPESLAEALEHARAGLARGVGAFGDAAAEYAAAHQGLLIDRVGVPEPPIPMTGRDVLIVTGGAAAAEQLRRLRGYVSDRRPVVLVLPDGAELLTGTRGVPQADLLVGDPRQFNDAVLRALPRLLVPGEPSEEARITAERLGLLLIGFPGAQGPEDAALLMADAADARCIVITGPGLSLPEFLDRGRIGMAGSVLTRIIAGGRVVPADQAADLHRREVPGWGLAALLLAGLAAVAAAVATTPVGQQWLDTAGSWL